MQRSIFSLILIIFIYIRKTQKIEIHINYSYNLSDEVSSYLHYKVLFSYPFLATIVILLCYKIGIKELSSRENIYKKVFLILI